jgi:fucose permease
VAWPSIRATFHLPLDAVGAWLITATAGSILSSFSAGYVASLIGVGPLLAISTAGVGLGLLAYGLTPTWWLMVLSGLLSGLGSGAAHVGLNAHFAAHLGTRALNWLHACFGLGATLGPLVMTSFLRAGLSWRWGYGAAGVWMMMLAAAFTLTLNRWSGSTEEARRDPAHLSGASNTWETLRIPLVWLSLMVFFAYTGVESTAGQWAYSLFTDARSVPETVAGVWMTVYWGGLAGGRLLLGPLADRIGTVPLLRVCMLAVTLGAGLVWWHATDLLSFIGLALMGFAQGPIFPSLVSVTPQRVSIGHVDNAIGFQVAAASLGAAALSSVAGVLASWLTLEVVAPFTVAWAAAAVVLHELTLRRARRVSPAPRSG